MRDRSIVRAGGTVLVTTLAVSLVSASALAQGATSAPSPAPPSVAGVLPLAQATDPLPAGRYVDRSTGQAIAFDLGDGWSFAAPPTRTSASP
jgi:hypothetical protein